MNAVLAKVSDILRPREIESDSTVTARLPITRFSRRSSRQASQPPNGTTLRPCEIEITLSTNLLSIGTSSGCSQCPCAAKRSHTLGSLRGQEVAGESAEAPVARMRAVEDTSLMSHINEGMAVGDANARAVSAAVVMQNAMRVYWARQSFRSALQERKQSEAAAMRTLVLTALQATSRQNYNRSRLAAGEIQKCIRRHLSREVYKERRSVCIRLNRVVCGMWWKRQAAKRHWQRRVAGAILLQRWFRSQDWNKLKPVVLENDDQELETGEVKMLYGNDCKPACMCIARDESFLGLLVPEIFVATLLYPTSIADKVYVMYHGTPSLERAALIEQKGFTPSTGGLLGPGVYVTRDVKKAEEYGRGGVIFEVLVRVGRVCDIRDHDVAIPVGVKKTAGVAQRMVPAASLHPRGWSDNGYDTAWVHPQCPEHVFKGGKGWEKGYKEETCVFDAERVTVQRRIVWDTDRADVQKIQWLFEEDSDRLRGHDETYGRWIPFSRRNSIMLESHYLVYADKSKGGGSKVIVTIEKDRKRYNRHTGLQYEVDLSRKKERNIMTGFERRLHRRQLSSSDPAPSTSASTRSPSSPAPDLPVSIRQSVATNATKSYGAGGCGEGDACVRQKGCRCTCM